MTAQHVRKAPGQLFPVYREHWSSTVPIMHIEWCAQGNNNTSAIVYIELLILLEDAKTAVEYPNWGRIKKITK